MIKAILFDMDGVLIESDEASFRYFNSILQTWNFKPVSEAVWRKKCLGRSAFDAVKALLPDSSDAEINEMVKLPYAPFIRYLKLMPGIKTVLRGLNKKYTIAIVTNRRRRHAHAILILENFKIRRYFRVVICKEDTKNPKPAPDPLLKALKILHVKPSEAVYVGDGEVDAVASKNAKVKSIIFSKGRVKGADYSIKTLRELPRAIENINKIAK